MKFLQINGYAIYLGMILAYFGIGVGEDITAFLIITIPTILLVQIKGMTNEQP